MVSLARKIREIERHQGKFDLLLATGDLVTDGSSEAFGWCLDYLQNDEVRGGDASRAATRGLGFDPDRRILLPGNHDRFIVLGSDFSKSTRLSNVLCKPRPRTPMLSGIGDVKPLSVRPESS
jgi:3',5'-cyclic AMP phosphodiesterase CpdA